MKNAKFFLAPVIICLVGISCTENQSVEVERDSAGALSGDVYRNDRVGWTMRIPDGWNVMSKETTDEVYSKANQIAEDSGGLEMGGSKTLLNFKRDFGNDSFLSVTQSWKGMGLIVAPDSFEFLKSQKDALENIMRSQGVTVDFTLNKEETIDRKTFKRFDATASNGVSQTYYFALQDKFFFCAILTYTSNSSKEELFEAWQSSRFDR